MFNNSNNIIDQLTEKLKHEDLEISTRAIKNFDLKLKTKLLSFQNFSQFQIENLITNLFFLIRTNLSREGKGKKTDLDTLSKALQLMKESLEFASNNFRKNLRNNNILVILSEISQSLKAETIQSLCNSIIERIVNEEKFFPDLKDDNNFHQANSFCADVSIKNNSINEKNFSSSLNNNSSLNSSKLLKKTIQKNEQNLNFTQNFVQIKIFNLIKSFPEVYITQREEQVFFDTNINLKFGDYMQISKNLYEVYYSLMQDYPVEYFLQNSDLIKSVLILLDKADFNEYGVILMKLFDRMYFLIQKKIEFYKESYTKITTSVSQYIPDMNHYNTCFNLVYPPVHNFIGNSQKTDSTCTISVRDFLVMSVQSLIQSMYDVKKLPFYFNLLEKYFQIFGKIILLSYNNCPNKNEANEHMAIIYDVLTRLHSLIQYYFNYTDIDHGKISDIPLCKFFVQILTNMNEEYLIQLLAFYTPDVITIIKDIIFIFEDSKEKLVCDFVEKLSSIIFALHERYNKAISKSDTTSSTNFKLINELKNLIEDLKNSDKIRNCIEIFNYFRNEFDQKKLNPNIDYEKFLNNFDGILIAFKFFLETERNSENFETTIQKFSFMKILCGAYYGYNREDRNGKNSRLVLVKKCFLKLLSFLNTLTIQADYKFKLFIYKNIYTQLLKDEEGSEIISKIIHQDLSTFFLILNELSKCQSIEEPNSSYDIDVTNKIDLNNNSLENILNEIIYTMLQQALLNKISTECYSALLPLKLSNTKHRSLHNQIDLKLVESLSGRINVFVKYLRLLFSKSEMIRLNCINYFRLFDVSSVTKGFKTIEFVTFSINYSQLKQGDIIYLIRSAEKEIPNLIKNITLNSNIDIELFPLLNIFYSNKIEYNLKASTIEQMCYLIGIDKYKKIFLEIFEFSIQKIHEIFSQTFNRDREEQTFMKNDKLNYLQNLLKLIILIIIFYRNESTVKQFISITLDDDTVNKNSLNVVCSLLKILFNENLQNKNKHMLGVYSIALLFLIAFNPDNFFNEISSCLDTHKSDHQREKNKLTLLIPKIFQDYYHLDIVPNKFVSLVSKDNEDLYDTNFIKLIDHTCNKYTLLYIRSKDASDHIYDKKIIKPINTVKLNLKSILKDNAGKAPNYLQIYLTLSDFFSNIVNDCDIYDKYAEEFLLIFSFFKKVMPIKPEEKNLISDFLALFNTLAGMSNGALNIDHSPTVLKSMNDILENYIAYITLSAGHKQFVEGLNRPWAENQIFLIELCNCLINNEIMFKNKNFSFILRNRRLIYKFFETFNNLLIFDDSLKPIRLLIIRVQIIYFKTLEVSPTDDILAETEIESESDRDLYLLFKKFLFNSMNTLDFYLGKYNVDSIESSSNDNNCTEEGFIDIRLITKILEYINVIAESSSNNAYACELIYKKSFTIMKYLNTKFLDLNLLSLQIFNNLLKNLKCENMHNDKEEAKPTIADFFTKHSTLLSTIFENIISTSSSSNSITPFIYQINLLTFLNFSLETFCRLEQDSEFHSDFLLMNEKLLDESQLAFLLILIEKNLDKNSLFCACVLKLISNLLNLNPNFYENFFLNTNFYETVNEIFRKEKEKIMREKGKLCVEEKILQFEFCDKNFEKKLFYKNKIESLLNINEGLFLVIKSFTKVEKKFLFDSENIYHRNRMILNEIFMNSFYLAEEVEILAKSLFESEIILTGEFNFSNFYSEHIKIDIFHDFAVKHFTLLNFLFHMEKNFIYQNILGNLSGEKFDDKQRFFDLLVDLLKFEKKIFKNSEKNEIIEVFEIPLSFAKILPCVFELISQINSDSKTDSNYNMNSVGNFIKLKNEGEILLILMTAFNSVYKIKTDTIFSKSQNNSNIKYKFDLKNDSDVSNKNILIQAISSILSTSQNCKKIFIKSNFINVFIDYVSQISEILLEVNLNRNSTQNKNNFTFANKSSQKIQSVGNIISSSSYNEEFLVSEMKNVLILFCNLLYKFEDCEERDSLYGLNTYAFYSQSESKKKEKFSQNSFLYLLSEIFYEVIRTPILFENYLKVLMNLVSKNDQAKKSFTLNFNSSDKETFLFLILDYFNKNFLNLNSNPNFELFIKFLKCLFQNKAVVLYLQKIKFVENLLKDFENLIVNKKHTHTQNLKFIEQILNLLISLSFEAEISKKMISKELIENLSNFILKVKNENVIYNTLFLFRNFCFVPSNKTHFLVNENLFGSIFAFLSGNYSIRIKFILSHLIWVLLYNNQTVFYFY